MKTEFRVLNIEELKKIYNLATDIVKECKKNNYKYIFMGPNGVKVTDSYRLAAYAGFFFEKFVAVPYDVIMSIKAVNPFKVEMVKDKFLSFKLIDKNETEIFTISVVEPNVLIPKFDFLEKELENYIDCMEFGRQELKEALEICAKYSNSCIFDLMEQRVKLEAVENDEILHSIKMGVVKKTRPFKIVLDPNYVLNYVKKASNSITIKISFRNSSSFVHMKEYGKAYDFILMPIAFRD